MSGGCGCNALLSHTKDKWYIQYGKCPKISHTKMANKTAYANSAVPDQTVPEGAV